MTGDPYLFGQTLQDKLADLSRIAALKEPILRNLLITQRYCDLSKDLARVLGTDNANWSTFACWASKTAGQSIRKEEVPPELVRLLQIDARIDRHLHKFYDKLGCLSFLAPRIDPLDLARSVLDEVSDQIAIGNLRVFAELAPLFAEFVHRFEESAGEPSEIREKKLQEFISGLKRGPASAGGQDDLKDAFAAYYQAAICNEPTAKAQVLLLGNALIGFHEQTRLQENIAGALDAPFSEKVYLRFEGIIRPRAVVWLVRALVHEAVHFMASEFLDDWQRIATRYLMRLNAPNGGEIPLGSDLPPQTFDPLLAVLDNPSLVQFLSRFDSDLTTTKGSGAINWTKLEDRMKFIGELFRVSQRQPKWFDPPFSDPILDQICNGRVPSAGL